MDEAQRAALAQMLIKQSLQEQLGKPKSVEGQLYQSRALNSPFVNEFTQDWGEAPRFQDPRYDLESALRQQSISGDVFGRDTYDPRTNDANFSRMAMGEPLQGRIHGDSRFKATDHPTMWMERFMQLSHQNPEDLGINNPSDAGRWLLARRLANQ
jgi:hypothetical protein